MIPHTTKPTFQEVRNNFLHLVIFIFIGFFFACGQKKVESKAVNKQGDKSMLSTEIKEPILSDSIMQLIITNKTDSLKAEQASLFTQKAGKYNLQYTLQEVNLDSTSNKEVVLFATYNDLDKNDTIYFPDEEVFIFRKVKTAWKLIDAERVSNPRNHTLQHTIDTLHQLLLLQSVGTGSGYGAIFNEFYKIQADTLAHLLTIPQEEFSSGIHYHFAEIILSKEDFDTGNILESTYQVINNNNIQVNCHYDFWVEKANKRISLLNTSFKLNYQLDKQKDEFLLLPNQKIGNYSLSNQGDIDIDNFVNIYTDTLKLLAKNGNKHQKYYLKYFDFDKYKNN
jgi:hypothetical protein